MKRLLGVVIVAAIAGAAGAAWATHTFPDVSNGSAFHTEVGNVQGAGIVTGFPDGTFRPLDPINRQQVAGWLNRTGTRVAFGQGSATAMVVNVTQNVATATITSGAVGGVGGFVVLTGNLLVSTNDVGHCPCRAGLVIFDDNGMGTNTGVVDTDVPGVADETGSARARVSYTWVRPIPPNVTRTYTLAVAHLDANVASVFASGSLTAQYVPFAGDGDNSL
jgi:S-layer homology domain